MNAELPLGEVPYLWSYNVIVKKQRRIVVLMADQFDMASSPRAPDERESQKTTLAAAVPASSHTPVFEVRSVRCAFCWHGLSPGQLSRS